LGLRIILYLEENKMVDEKKEYDIAETFAGIPLSYDQAHRISFLKEKATCLLREIDSLCPKSRETSLALTHLETVVMWATKAISREHI